MSLLDDVSIVVTPNGYKAGELYAVIPSNGDADMDVTRATAATRVDENGLVNYAEVIGGEEVSDGNFLLTGTQEQNTTGTYWTTGTGWTISGGTANFTPNGSFINLTQSGILTSGKNYTVIYTLSNVTAGNVRARLGTQDGATSSSDGIYTRIITANGADFSIRTNGAFSGSVDNVSVKEVDRDNVPRIDYTGGGCPHILAEPQRTNLVTYSEDFSEWSIARATLGANITAPNGANDGYSIIATAVADDHYVSESISVVDTNIYTYSAYLKKGSKSWARLWNTLVGYVDFDLENGVVGTQSSAVGSIELFGDGWYRCSIVYTATSTGNNSHRIYTLDGDNDKVFLGDGSTINLYMFGAQLEEGSYATSYIPNSGTAAGVTRNQDIFTRDGIGSLINSEEGVLFVEMAALADDETNREITLSDGSAVNYVLIRFNNGGSNRIYTRVDVDAGGGMQYFDLDTNHTITDVNKIAIRWGASNFATFINGVKVGSQLSGSSFSADTLNELNFDNGTGGSNFNGKVKQLQVYKTALTDEQLLQLTGESGTDFYESYAEMAAALTYTLQ